MAEVYLKKKTHLPRKKINVVYLSYYMGNYVQLDKNYINKKICVVCIYTV